MSLTKKTLLAELVCSKPEKLSEKVFGYDAYVKPVSEFQRSRRMASLVDKDGKIDNAAMARARVYTLIDHLCEKDGTPLFTDKDAKSLLEVDAFKIDLINRQIEQWVAEREGKYRGE
jgi:hypothetical protein